MKFKVTNLKTGEEAEISQTADGTGGYGNGSENTNPTIIPLLRDKHTVYLAGGDKMIIRKFTVSTQVKNVDLLIYGDSISEPEAYYPKLNLSKSWVQLIKNNIEEKGGKVLISGRSSSGLYLLKDRIQNELPYIKAKYVMVTIGTNGGVTEEGLSEIIDYIISCGAIPIINNIPCNESGTQIATNAIISRIKKKIKFNF